MSRITEKFLNARVALLNSLLARPKESYSRDASGKLTANVGNLALSHEYGGVSVREMVNDMGGETGACGLYASVTKRECEIAIGGAIWGIQTARDELEKLRKELESAQELREAARELLLVIETPRSRRAAQAWKRLSDAVALQ